MPGSPCRTVLHHAVRRAVLRPQALKTPAEYEALLRSKFKGLPEDWIPQIAEQAAVSPASSAGGWGGQ